MARKAKFAKVATVTEVFAIGEETISLTRDEEIPAMSDNALEILTTNGHIREVNESEMEDVEDT